MPPSPVRTGAAVLLIAVGIATAGCRPSGAGTSTPGAETASKVAEPGAGTAATPGPRKMAPAELQATLAAGDTLLINVCTSRSSGELPDTDLAIAYNRLHEAADRLPADKSARIAIYCTSGGMSKDATDALMALGYSDIIDLKGGTKAWRKAGLPIGDRTQ